MPCACGTTAAKNRKYRPPLPRHAQWIRLPAGSEAEDRDLGEEPEDAAADEASGGETDDFVSREERRAIKRLTGAWVQPGTHNIDRWRDDILNDLEHLQSIHDKCLNAQREPDAEIGSRSPARFGSSAKKEARCWCSVRSRRTADYVQRELEKRLGEKVGLVNADVGGDTRARILNAFSPKYNDLPTRSKNGKSQSSAMKPLPEMHILVSTDVLAEGVNLQEAGCILNYDLHWNPTRLIQRIGRVDRRLKADEPDHSFEILNVIPPKAIDDVIELVDTVEQRKRKISRLLGIDQSFFKATDEEGTLKEFNRLYEGGQTPREGQLVEYVRQITLNSEEKALADCLPAGAMGVWAGAAAGWAFRAVRSGMAQAGQRRRQLAARQRHPGSGPKTVRRADRFAPPAARRVRKAASRPTRPRFSNCWHTQSRVKKAASRATPQRCKKD